MTKDLKHFSALVSGKDGSPGGQWRGWGYSSWGKHLPSMCKALIWFPAIEESRAAAVEVWLAALEAKLISQLLPSSVEMCRQVWRQVSRQKCLAGAAHWANKYLSSSGRSWVEYFIRQLYKNHRGLKGCPGDVAHGLRPSYLLPPPF